MLKNVLFNNENYLSNLFWLRCEKNIKFKFNNKSFWVFNNIWFNNTLFNNDLYKKYWLPFQMD